MFRTARFFIILMDAKYLQNLLENVQCGSCSISDALDALRHWPVEEISCANLDHQRSLRTGRPEVVYGENKSADQLIDILARLEKHSHPVMATRVSPDKAAKILGRHTNLQYYEEARILVGNPVAPEMGESVLGTIVVLAAGTSDIPVAEEARITASSLGNRVEKLYDVGVAGLHRLLSQQALLDSASVLIVVAGMEGALPSVVGGLVTQPVIAVPTSVGYGASFGGVAALLGMLNSCAPGVAVVNIDNGFGAGCIASSINQKRRAHVAGG